METKPCLATFSIDLIPSTEAECDYLYGWIKNVTYTKILPKMVNPRDIAGNAEEE